MCSFPNFEPVRCSMSSSNYCLLTCTQLFQEAANVVWYPHLFKNLPQFFVIHTKSLAQSLKQMLVWNNLRSKVFPSLLFPSIYLHCSLKKASYLSLLFSGTLHSVGYIFPLLLCLCFSFPQLLSLLRQPLCLLAFLFSGDGFWSLPPVQCYRHSVY